MSNGAWLRPTKRKDNRRPPRFGVCDIEARKWIEFLIIGFYSKIYDGDAWTDEIYRDFESLDEFVEFVFSDENKTNDIYAHFGGKYDFNFLLKEFWKNRESYIIGELIPRGSGLLNFSVSTFTRHETLPNTVDEKNILRRNKDGSFLVRKRTINFRDSSAMLPAGLASLTENFGVEHKKLEIDYDKIERVTPELREYLEYDCRGLYQCIEKFYEWPIIRKAGFAKTIAGQSMKILQTYLKQPIRALVGEVDDDIRSSYFGGRTEIFKPNFQQTTRSGIMRCYDVNSLYPYAMMLGEFPLSRKASRIDFIHDTLPGFYDVTVDVPDMYIPPLGAVIKAGVDYKFIFPTGTFRGSWTSIELQYAMSLGVKILKVHKGHLFNKGEPIFRDYIKDLYELRKNSKKNSIDNVLCKLLMNSSYGRFGINRDREKLEFDYGQPGVELHSTFDLDDVQIFRIMKRQEYAEDLFSHPAITSWVTSIARIHMHKLFIQAPDDLYNTDTDSLFTTHKYEANEEELGALKYEYSLRSACFLLPKTYFVESVLPLFEDPSEESSTPCGCGSKKKFRLCCGKRTTKITMKGFDRRKTAHFTYEDFYQCLEGDLKRLRTVNPRKFATLKTAFKKKKFLTMLEESPRQLRSRYNKRRLVRRSWDQNFDTEPLFVKDGEVKNLDFKKESKADKEYRILAEEHFYGTRNL